MLAGDGLSNRPIAPRVGLGAWTVGKWRARYRQEGLQGLYNELRSGRTRSISGSNFQQWCMSSHFAQLQL